MSIESLTPPGFVVVEGPIGVGKTSLVTRLSESLSAETLLEAPEANPFLEKFYKAGESAAFPTQLYFLFQRSRQLEQVRQSDLFRSALVADYMLEKDRLFAGLNLDHDELALYEQVYERLSMEAPVPDLVVYLQAPVEVLMERIHKRGRSHESSMDAMYIKRLSDAYTDFFYHYDKSPLLIINATEINPVDREEDFNLLLEQICTVKSGKHYFNPAPLLL